MSKKEPIVHFEGKDMPASEWLQLVCERRARIEAENEAEAQRLGYPNLISMQHESAPRPTAAESEAMDAIPESKAVRVGRVFRSIEEWHADPYVDQNGR